jgi:hypothetical protein
MPMLLCGYLDYFQTVFLLTYLLLFLTLSIVISTP